MVEHIGVEPMTSCRPCKRPIVFSRINHIIKDDFLFSNKTQNEKVSVTGSAYEYAYGEHSFCRRPA